MACSALQVERSARYYQYIDSQPFSHPLTLDEQWKRRVKQLAAPQLAAKLPGLVAGAHSRLTK